MAAEQNLMSQHSVVGLPDLSNVHQLIDKNRYGPLPATPEEWAKYKLTDEQIKFFNENGYLLGVPVLTEAQVDDLIAELNTLIDPTVRHAGHGLFHEFHLNETNDPSAVLSHALGHWRITPAFHDLVFHPALAITSSQLLNNTAIRFWHDQFFVKPPYYGGNVAWHQDYSYWTRTGPMQHLTIHIALDDQTIENGCLHYIPGSHKWGDTPLPITDRHFKDMESIMTVLTEEQQKNFKPAPMLLKKGQACFHHALTVHGSYANKSNGPRRAAVINVFSDGTRSLTDKSLLDGIPVYPPGTKLEGQFFPLMFDPKTASCK